MISFWLKHAVCKRIMKGCVWQTYADLQESAVPWYKIHLSDYRFSIFRHRFYIVYVVILSLHYTGKSRFYSQLNITNPGEVIPNIVNKFLVLGLLHDEYYLVLYAKFFHIGVFVENLRSLLFWDVMQHWLVVTDVSGWPVDSIFFKGPTIQVQEEFFLRLHGLWRWD